MDIDYIKENYYFETLNEKHNLKDFFSESDALNDFLKNDALNQQKNKFSKAIKFYVKKNGFINLKKDDEKIKRINKIIQHHPLKTFYLYFDLKSLE